MELEDRIISIYLRIDAFYKKFTASSPLRHGGFSPKLTDVEVLTIEIIGEITGHHSDRAIWRYFNEHWKTWFPNLNAYKTFAKQCANLCWLKQALLAALFPPKHDVHIIDGVPMPLCHKARAYRSAMLCEFAQWGYCAAKKEHYYGFRGHVVITPSGYIHDFILTPANVSERASLYDTANNINGLLIGDKGFLGEELKQEMAKNGIDLQTPLRENMTDKRPEALVGMMMKMRKRVETTLSLLCEHFALTKIKAHDMWHYTSKLTRKILAYNFYIDLKSWESS